MTPQRIALIVATALLATLTVAVKNDSFPAWTVYLTLAMTFLSTIVLALNGSVKTPTDADVAKLARLVKPRTAETAAEMINRGGAGLGVVALFIFFPTVAIILVGVLNGCSAAQQKTEVDCLACAQGAQGFLLTKPDGGMSCMVKIFDGGAE